MHLDRRTAIGGALALLASAQSARAQSLRMDEALAAKLVAAAGAQVGVTLHYDSSYQRLAFPGGDVPRERGVCTDVVVRAYRDAFDIDLQERVNRDMRASFASYPARWGLSKPDPNIDHRRVPNLRVFFARQGAELAVPAVTRDWQPGDIVTQELAPPGSTKPGLPHIGIVADAFAASAARRMVIHNIGAGTRLEDILETYRITGRYRWLPGRRA